MLLIGMMIQTAACQAKPKIVWVETKYKVEAIPGDPNSYKISKALYSKLLKIIADLEAKVMLLELEKEKD